MINTEEFLEKCRVNPLEKIDTSDDSYWTLKDLLDHYKELLNLPVVGVELKEKYKISFDDWFTKFVNKDLDHNYWFKGKKYEFYELVHLYNTNQI